MQQHAQRNGNALEHAAGELEGIGAQHPLGLGEADILHQLDHSGKNSVPVGLPVSFGILPDPFGNLSIGIQRQARILEDQGDLPAAVSVPFVFRQSDHFLPFEAQAPADLGVIGQKPDGAVQEGGLAAAAAADHGQDLSVTEGQRQVDHGMICFVIRDIQMFRFQNIGHDSLSLQ